MMRLDCTGRIWWVAVVMSGLLGAVIALSLIHISEPTRPY